MDFLSMNETISIAPHDNYNTFLQPITIVEADKDSSQENRLSRSFESLQSLAR